MQQLRLELGALGDVSRERPQAAVRQSLRRHLDDVDAPVLPAGPPFAGDDLPRRQLGDRRRHPGNLLGEHEVGDGHRGDLLARVARQGASRRVDVDESAFRVGHEDAFSGLLEEHAEVVLALAQRGVGLLALGDLARDAE